MSENILKIIMMGLDNSGKTSIIYTLEQRFASIYALKPTVSFTVREDFKILGIPVKIWDLGGQKQYRDEYLSKKGFIFGETNLIFFVIDIQDPKRFSEAIDYFQRSIDFMQKIGLSPKIIVLLHKTDPEIKDTKKIRKNIELVKTQFAQLPKTIELDFYETSIYDRENLSKAFVAGIFKALPKTAVLQEALNEFMKNSDSLAVMLLDENVLILAEASIDTTARNICSISGPYFANMTEKMIKYNLMPPSVLEAQMEDGWLFHKPIKINGTSRFYLVFFTKERSLDKINKLLPSITQEISNLIKYVV
ncbi:MAG: ADP-ribosylation factor-like protein [Candidatus Helarchaeota archaeon]